MRHICVLVCLFFVLVGCKKEKELQPALQLENLFEIRKNSDDPVEKKIYEIYQEYKVPVFFNDSIGQVYIMDDVQGKPVYKVEKIDLAWTFNGYAKQVFDFEYMKDETQKLKALAIISNYLKDVSPALRPFSFFVTQSGTKSDQGNIVERFQKGSFLISYRTVYMTGDWTDALEIQTPGLIKRQMILSKINNYPDDIADFSMVSQAAWYGGLNWPVIDPSLPKGWKEAEALYDEWAGAKWYTEEELAAMRIRAREVIGKFGFVKGHQVTQGLQGPQNATNDLNNFVQEMLKYKPSEFQELWGKHPLVMKKFQILRNVIENKMQVKL